MPETLRLTPRLQLVASFIRPGRPVADIGSDHALLPAYLVSTGHSPSVLACDLRKGPLQRGRENVELYGVGEKVTLRLSDGLDSIGRDEADDIVIAGMGGDLIAEIVGRCGWLRSGDKHLILQPMSVEERLRAFLYRSGFEINREAVAREGKRLYLVMSVKFTGKNTQADEFACFTGLLQQIGGKTEGEYLHRQAIELKKKAAGLRKSELPENRRLAAESEELALRIEEVANELLLKI